MTPFTHGFCDELLKLGGVLGGVAKGGKFLGKRFMKHPFFYGSGGIGAYSGIRAAQKPKQRRIQARAGRPSQAYYINYHPLIGPVRQTKAQRRRESLYLPARFKKE